MVVFLKLVVSAKAVMTSPSAEITNMQQKTELFFLRILNHKNNAVTVLSQCASTDLHFVLKQLQIEKKSTAGITEGHAVQLTSLLISSWRSGAERAVALIMVEVWLSVNFFMQRWPATILQTWSNGQNLNLVKLKLYMKKNDGTISNKKVN